MRWPRLPRRRDPETVLITGIKSAVRQADLTQIRSLLLRHRHTVGFGVSQANELAAIIAGRVDDSVDHAEASSRLTALAQSPHLLPQRASSWFVLENLSRTIGCFLASQAFTDRGMAALIDSADPTKMFLAHLHQRDVERARDVWEKVAHHDSPFWHDAGHYLWLWTNREFGRPHWSEDTQWSATVQDKPVVIVGPAPTSMTQSTLSEQSLVARVIMQGVLEWEATADPLGGQCDLAYANRETRNWIRENNLWSALEKFQAVSFRIDQSASEWAKWGSSLRSAHDPHRLMIGGSSANMIPLMVWDILRVPGVSLTVAGTTFFASATAYTSSNRRFKHTVGRTTDETGSTGELFERCPTFARHNVTENLTLVANLAHAGALSVDAECRQVVEMSLRDYLVELDTLYGIERR